MADTPLTAKKYVDGIYIPAGLLVFGTFIMKKEWTPYAALLAILLGVWKFTSSRTLYSDSIPSRWFYAYPQRRAEPKKVLKPDAFQDFELKEKTIISHNVAMLVPDGIARFSYRVF